MFVKNHPADLDIAHHHLSWADFDSLARGDGGADVIRRLRRTQRSRRLLQLRVLMDEVVLDPELYGPFSTPEDAWNLLARVEAIAPDEFDQIVAHPYTGAWLAHARRVVNKVIVEPDRPIWIHVGHLHALAAAAAVRAGISFEARIPVRDGEAILPTLGMARLPAAQRWSVADVRCDGDGVRLTSATTEVLLPTDTSEDAPGWLGMRRLVTQDINGSRLDIRLDDLDPYRDLHDVVQADRISADEVKAWAEQLDGAWRLMVECVPMLADGFAVGFDSLVPRPAVPFRYLSGSTGETFGSAVIARPPNAKLLASALVHEFQHSRLHALTHLTRLHEADPRQRFYTLWRDDPRPVGGVLHGVYAFFGMTAFWRSLAATDDRRAKFEMAYCRTGTWRTLQQLRHDPTLTDVGQRFVEGIAERIGPWCAEPIPEDIATHAESATADHYAGWRLRHLRPTPETVASLSDGWLSGDTQQGTMMRPTDQAPQSEPDGSWSGARTELIRLGLDNPEGYQSLWQTVPGATAADFAYVSGNPGEAIDGYLAELGFDPDCVTAWVGLGLASFAQDATSPVAQALLRYPEIVRAVHREIRSRSASCPAPDELAAWIARRVNFLDREGSG